MADRLVSCPSCAKPYRLPEALAVPAGMTFPCFACNTPVPYDAPAASAPLTAPPGGAPRTAASSAQGARRAGDASKPRGRSGGSAGRARPVAAPQPQTPEQKEKEQQKMILIASISGVVLLVGIFLLVKFLPESRPPSWRSPEELAQAKAALEEKKKAEERSAQFKAVPVSPEIPPTVVPSADSPQVKQILRVLMMADGYNVYRHVDSLPDVTPEQRAAMDKDVDLVCKKDGGGPAQEARARLVTEGRRAVPSLLSVFTIHWEKDKWNTDEEKYANFEVQKLLGDITKGHRPSDLVVPFEGKDTKATATDFDRVARMWVNWWGVKGKKLETFRDSSQ